jgi:hypothetical protein
MYSAPCAMVNAGTATGETHSTTDELSCRGVGVVIIELCRYWPRRARQSWTLRARPCPIGWATRDRHGQSRTD